MIVKDTNSIVNFFVADSDGLPATGKSSYITATISINGGAASAISESISEIDSTNQPGWYRFRSTFSTSGNAFIMFTCSGCKIMPWEDNIVTIDVADANTIWGYSFSGATASNHLYNASMYANSAYAAVGNINIPTPPTTSAIAASVWGYDLNSDPLQDSIIASDWMKTLPSSSDISALVWGSTFIRTTHMTGDEPADVIVNYVWTYGGAYNQQHPYSTAFDILDATPTAASNASAVWDYSIKSGATSYTVSQAGYKLRSIASIPGSVWSYSFTTGGPSAGNYIQSISSISSSVWSYTIGTPATPVSTYLGSIGSIPHDVWDYGDGTSRTINNTIPTVASIQDGLATTANINDAVATIGSSIADVSTHGDASWSTATGFATPYDIPTADITAIKNKVNSLHNTDLTGIATSSNVIDAKDAIIAAIPAIPTDYAKASDLDGLSTFDPDTDTVTINSTQAATLAAASDLDSVATKVELIKSKTDNLPTNPAATGDAMTLTAAYDAAKTASQFNAATDTVTINATQAATMVTATGFATPSDIPTSDITAIKTKVDALHNTDLTGIATSANVTAAQTAIIAAMPTIPTDYAKTTDLDGLSTFNAATDTVTINATQAATMVTADVSGLATSQNVTDATSTITGSIANIDIPTPPTAGDIATSVWDYTWGTVTASTRIDSMYSNINALPDTNEITSSVWGNSSGVRSLNNSFYGTGANSRFAVKDDIQDPPIGLTAEDVWNYKIVNNISARSYLTAISTSAASIPGINTSIGTINTSITSINGSIGSINDSVTSINGSIGSINSSVASINGSIGTINTTITGINSGIGSLNSTVAYLDAGLFNWRISTNKLITSVSNTEVEYTVSRDINSNIIGIRPVQ